MIRLVWLLVAAEVLGLPFELSAWETHLKAIDSSLPTTTASNNNICYYFPLKQACSGEAIGALLRQSPVANVLTWTPTAADCSKLLDKQLPSMERAASSLFGPAITSAAAAGVTNFELLAQSWVLRAGHHVLSVKQAAFVAAINSISDWKTVHCDGANLLYDGKTIAKPDFMGTVDCDILDTVFLDVCANGSCALAVGITCCESNKLSTCCGAHKSTVESECKSNASCAYKSTCCSLDSTLPCCVGPIVDLCDSGTCAVKESADCCITKPASKCCTNIAPMLATCKSNASCSFKSLCCTADPTYLCCTG